jgi:hypothetical protein
MPESILNYEKKSAEKPFPWRCPKCGQLSVTRVTIPYRCQRKLDSSVVTVEVPNLSVPRCSNCGELVFDYPADEQIRAALRTRLGSVETVLIEGQNLRLSTPHPNMVFGRYHRCHVINWMGEHGWTAREAQEGLKRLVVNQIRKDSLQASWKQGRNHSPESRADLVERNLTVEERAQLEALLRALRRADSTAQLRSEVVHRLVLPSEHCHLNEVTGQQHEMEEESNRRMVEFSREPERVEESPTDDEVVRIVFDSIEAAIRRHGTHIAFRQVRTTPEGLIVHFSAFELYQQLESRWPEQFRVELEQGARNDILIRPIKVSNSPFVFEFKVPWSGKQKGKPGVIPEKVVRDLVKIHQEKRGFAVTVFLKLLKTTAWAKQRGDQYTVSQMKQAVIDDLAKKHPDLSADVVRESAPIKIESDEAQIECTVTVWRVQRLP